VIIASKRIALAIVAVVPTTDELKQRIEAAIPGADVEVTDLTGGGDHFRASVSAPEFVGMSRIEQHRRVYAVFGAEIGGPIHALSLETRAE
jgi:stress-induced morphogen